MIKSQLAAVRYLIGGKGCTWGDFTAQSQSVIESYQFNRGKFLSLVENRAKPVVIIQTNYLKKLNHHLLFGDFINQSIIRALR